ncbi:hypothetical protein K4F52_001128 [Lecanicillium sp. MT-2017a]|nr:hypothetical protein K4F52_001128 [Lecanicillium sp. MT-2017a]
MASVSPTLLSAHSGSSATANNTTTTTTSRPAEPTARPPAAAGAGGSASPPGRPSRDDSAAPGANPHRVAEIADFNGQAAFVTTDGRVRNPVPSKLHGMADSKNGNFAVMHIDLKRSSERGERNAAAKRTSEGTEAAARIANQAGYQPVKRNKLAWPPQDDDASHNDGPAATRPPPPSLGLSPHDAKAEQARLLTLLRSVHPIVVVDQLCKALAYFGGIPGAPAPESSSAFPQSAGTNGSGSHLISWLAEIFPAREGNTASLGTPLIPDAASSIPGATPTAHTTQQQQQQGQQSTTSQSTDAAANAGGEAAAAPVKRGRGRPKGSKGKPKVPKPPDSEAHDPNASGGWPGYSQNPNSQTDGDPNATPAKKRGRPKGSKNKPKNTAPDDPHAPSSSAAPPAAEPYLPPIPQMANSLPPQSQQSQYNYPGSMNLDVSNMMGSGPQASNNNNWPGLGIQSTPNAAMANKPPKKRKPGSTSQPEQDNMSQSTSADQAKRRRISRDAHHPDSNPSSSQMLSSATFNAPPRPNSQQQQQQRTQQQAFSQHQSPTLGTQRPGMNVPRNSSSSSNMYNTQHMLMHPADLFNQQRQLPNDMNASNTTTTSSTNPNPNTNNPSAPTASTTTTARSNSARNSKSPLFPPAETNDPRRDAAARMGYGTPRQHQQHQPAVTTSASSPSLNNTHHQHQHQQFQQNYADQGGYMGLGYGTINSRSVQSAANAAAAAASFGGTSAVNSRGTSGGAATSFDVLGSGEQTSGMRNRMYRTMQQQQQQQQQQQRH